MKTDIGGKINKKIQLTCTHTLYRVEVLSNKNIGDFGPSLPSPPVFKNDETLRDFLTLKRNSEFCNTTTCY